MTDHYLALEVNCSTGELSHRPLTNEEIQNQNDTTLAQEKEISSQREKDIQYSSDVELVKQVSSGSKAIDVDVIGAIGRLIGIL